MENTAIKWRSIPELRQEPFVHGHCGRQHGEGANLSPLEGKADPRVLCLCQADQRFNGWILATDCSSQIFELPSIAPEQMQDPLSVKVRHMSPEIADCHVRQYHLQPTDMVVVWMGAHDV